MNDAAKRVTFFLAVTGAFALALVLRLPAFAPSYLWLDDQWIGVLVKMPRWATSSRSRRPFRSVSCCC